MSVARGNGEQRRGWFDLRRRDIRDGVTVLFLASTVLAATAAFATARFAFGVAGDDRAHLITITAALSVCCVIAVTFGFRRLQDLRKEILARRRIEEMAAALAGHDPLTNLPNRQFFTERLDESLRGRTAGSRVGVLVLDLDGFTPLNNRYGQKDGDCVLTEFAERASAAIPPDALLARWEATTLPCS